MDRGYIWALQKAGYKRADILKVLAYQEKLMGSIRERKNEESKNKVARAAWERRQMWGKFIVVRDEHPVEIRSRVSLMIALEIGKPTPLILDEAKRGFIYVQESDYALELFKKFGGFTFGMDRNWGYRNQGKAKRVTIEDIQKFLSSLRA
jgi:hypothetical protein